MQYRSTSDFSHTIVIQGKKILVKPDQVIESEIPLKYSFLEEVTHSNSDNEENAVIETHTPKDNENLLSLVESLKLNNESVQKEFNTFKKSVTKRLDILKEAIQNLENAVYKEE